jgi:hypothetical protein
MSRKNKISVEKELAEIFHFIGEKLSEIPPRKQKTVADAIGVSEPTITNYKYYGYRSCPPRADFATVYKILRYFLQRAPIEIPPQKNRARFPEP